MGDSKKAVAIPRKKHKMMCKATIEQIEANNPAMTVIDFSGSSLFQMKVKDYMPMLAEALSKNTVVTELYLDEVNLGNKQADSVAKIVSQNKSITKLSLARNKFDGAFGEEFARALPFNDTLKEIDFMGANFQDFALNAFLEAFENHNITVINIKWRLESRISFRLTKCITRNNNIARLKKAGRDVSNLIPKGYGEEPKSAFDRAETAPAAVASPTKTLDAEEAEEEEVDPEIPEQLGGGAAGVAPAENNDPPAPSGPVSPSRKDMEEAKLLFVQLKMDYTANPDMKDVDSLKFVLGDGKATEAWTQVEGLRHKYFIYDSENDVCSGVYVFYDQASLDKYMESELFKAQSQYPHVSEVTASVKDVMPGTEECIEKMSWANTPPTREDVCKARMLLVDITMNYETGVEGTPKSSDELYPAIAGGYTKLFSELEGLRGKYFCYDKEIDHCYGFYTFVDQESLDLYMGSDLFKQQGDPPHIEKLEFAVHEVLSGTERSMDLGSWKDDKEKMEKIDEKPSGDAGSAKPKTPEPISKKSPLNAVKNRSGRSQSEIGTETTAPKVSDRKSLWEDKRRKSLVGTKKRKKKLLPRALIAKIKENDPSIVEANFDNSSVFSSKKIEYCQLLHEAMKNNTNVKTLSMQLCGIDNSCAKYIGDILAETKTLEKVNLSNNRIQSEGGEHIANALQNNTSIVEMNLMTIELGNEALTKFLVMFDHNITLMNIVWRLDSRLSFRLNKAFVRNKEILRRKSLNKSYFHLLPNKFRELEGANEEETA